MAHLRAIHARGCNWEGCETIATNVLHNKRNEIVAFYCADHCEPAQARLEEQEGPDAI